MALKFGLNVNKKTGPRPAPASKRPAFDDADSDEEPPEVPNAKPKQNSKPDQPPKLSALSKDTKLQHGDISSQRSHQKVAEQAEAVDPNIYDYDAAYDALHAGRAAKEAERKRDAQERKPRYMTALLESAKVREKDRLRAQDKLLQREREEEGDSFADKDKFVTSAYKKQQEELRQAEEEERRKEAEDAKKNEGKGMQGFYRTLMEQDDARHREAVEAAKAIDPAAVRSENEDVPKEKTDADIARELKAQGRKVMINDEGEVADKRQLLSAGLNVAPKPKTAPVATSSKKDDQRQQASQGYTFDKRAQRERQTRMLEAQLEQAAKRAADEEAEQEREKEHQAKSRKVEAENRAASARERYLQRKKEAEAAKASTKQP